MQSCSICLGGIGSVAVVSTCVHRHVASRSAIRRVIPFLELVCNEFAGLIQVGIGFVVQTYQYRYAVIIADTRSFALEDREAACFLNETESVNEKVAVSIRRAIYLCTAAEFSVVFNMLAINRKCHLVPMLLAGSMVRYLAGFIAVDRHPL